tara:strand:+ start:427 stop:795 length:369 start_codon:yes stop_codon:yes gene_type:complete
MKMNETTTTTNGEITYVIGEKVEKSIKFNHDAERMSAALGISEKTINKYLKKGKKLLEALILRNVHSPSQIVESVYKVIHNESEIGIAIMFERVMTCIIAGVSEKMIEEHKSKLAHDLKAEA